MVNRQFLPPQDPKIVQCDDCKIPPADLEECGSCSCYHRRDFAGDCRDDSNRYADWQTIVLCPLHAAAQKMCEALRGVKLVIDMLEEGDTQGAMIALRSGQVAQEARAVLKEVDGG